MLLIDEKTDMQEDRGNRAVGRYTNAIFLLWVLIGLAVAAALFIVTIHVPIIRFFDSFFQ